MRLTTDESSKQELPEHVSRFGRTMDQVDDFYSKVREELKTKFDLSEYPDSTYSPMLNCPACRLLQRHIYTGNRISTISWTSNGTKMEVKAMRQHYACLSCGNIRCFGMAPGSVAIPEPEED